MAGRRRLLCHQPAQGSQTGIDIGGRLRRQACSDQGLRQARIVIREALLEPHPVRRLDQSEGGHQRCQQENAGSHGRAGHPELRRNKHPGREARRPLHEASETPRRSTGLRQTGPPPIDAVSGLHPSARIRPAPTRYARDCPRSRLSSSQVRLKPMKLRKRLVSGFHACCTKAAKRAVRTSGSGCSPGPLSAQANSNARALSSTQ